MLEDEEDQPEKEVSEFEPIRHDHHECERISFNISGERYETHLKTLAQFPETLLGDPSRRLRYFDPVRNEYFLDRNRPSFDAILYYYQSEGTLRRPHGVGIDIFCEEIQFYDLGAEKILNFKIEEGFLIEEEEPMPFNQFQKEVWLLLEHPETSTQAQVFAIFSVFVIGFSIFLFCLETVPKYNRYVLFGMTPNSTLVEEDPIPGFGNPFFVIESMCIAWFCFELILRLLACPDKKAFLTDIMNAVDVIAILPYFITLYTVLSENENAFVNKKDADENAEEEGLSLANLKVTRLARVFRVFKLSRHSAGLRIIMMTFQASMKEIRLLVFFLAILSVLFSSFVYFAEANDADSYFKSIPDAFWWSIITMTTVGYGDVSPIGFWGKCVGAVCVFAGLLALALPSPFIETNFMKFYTREGQQRQFMTECEGHVESCPFLPDHSKMSSFGGPLSGSQPSLDDLTEMSRKKIEKSGIELTRINESDEEDATAGYNELDKANQQNGEESDEISLASLMK